MICDHFFYWQDHARTFDSYEQWAIAEFAEALSTIPKTLAINAAMDAIDLLAALRVTWMKQKLSNREDDGEGEGFCDVLWLNYILDQLVDQYFLFISVYFDDIYSTFSTPPFCLSPATLFFLDIYELRWDTTLHSRLGAVFQHFLLHFRPQNVKRETRNLHHRIPRRRITDGMVSTWPMVQCEIRCSILPRC